MSNPYFEYPGIWILTTPSQVSVVTKDDVSDFGPYFPTGDGVIHKRGKRFKRLLLAKLINAEQAGNYVNSGTDDNILPLRPVIKVQGLLPWSREPDTVCSQMLWRVYQVKQKGLYIR